ncbi:MAG: carbonic anhydrase [Verrucomicrobia bacterium]|nr:carbonic anhydrase [Verrucomicrobiota bacterium]
MIKLIRGVHQFRSKEFGRYRELFRQLSTEGQKPHTLFITCADSRVLAELITQSKPGDLFVVKNIGNIVPTADVVGSTNSTAAAIEFAVQTLEVEDIVICGHSHCGAMGALIDENLNPESQPHLAGWMALAKPVRDVLEKAYGDLHQNREEMINTAALENVLFALDNLLTYPCVKTRLDAGTLRLHGWFFEIGTAELLVYDPEIKQFAPLIYSPGKPSASSEPSLF